MCHEISLVINNESFENNKSLKIEKAFDLFMSNLGF